jgi:uncharacterized OB-fold protein
MTLPSDTAPHLTSEHLVSLSADGTPHLIRGKCPNCGALSFPRADVCAKCLAELVEAIELSSEGMLYSFKVVHQVPGWNVPNGIGYVGGGIAGVDHGAYSIHNFAP